MSNKLLGFSQKVSAYNDKVGAVMKEVRAVQSDHGEILHEGMKVLGLKKSVVSSMLSKVVAKETPAVDTGEVQEQPQGNLEMKEVTIIGGVGETAMPPAGDSVATGNVQNAAEAAE